MTVRYHPRRGVEVPDYQCVSDSDPSRRAAAARPSPAHGVDAAIGQLLLDTVTPLALEVALTVQAELEARADRSRRSCAAQPRRTRPPPRRARPPPLPRRRPRQPARRRQPRSRLERRAARPASRPGRLRPRQPPPPTPRSPTQHKARIRALATDFPALWSDPATPQRERKRMARLLIDDVTLHQDRPDPPARPLPRRADHQPHHPDPAQRLAGPPDRPRHPRHARPAARRPHRRRDRRTRSTPPATAPAPNKPFTAGIVLHLRRAHHLPSHADRLRARGLLTIDRDRPTTRRAPQHHQGLAPRRPAQLPQGQRQERTALRAAHTRRPPPRQTQGWRLTNREPTQPSPGGAL